MSEARGRGLTCILGCLKEDYSDRKVSIRMLFRFTSPIFIIIYLSFGFASDDSLVSTCFAKIRMFATVNADFRNHLDHAAKLSRLDTLIQTIVHKIGKLCTQEEKDYVIQYLNNHQQAISLTENVVRNLTHQEKDHLNIWHNLNDTNSQQQMFLRKFHGLSQKNQTVLRNSFNNILNTFVRSALDPELRTALSRFNLSDQKQIELLFREKQFKDIQHVIIERLNHTQLPDRYKHKAYEFLSKLYSE